MVQHLLVPLDGSPMAEVALPVASDLARRTGARVTLLHVLELGASSLVHGSHHLTEAEEAERYLEETAKKAFPAEARVQRHVHTRQVRDLAHSLVDHADELEPDLVIMCAHGDERLRDWLSGNIAQQVVKRGVIPVLLLQPGPGGEIRYPFRRILIPLDGEPEHEHSLPPAAALARACSATARLLTVVPTTEALSGAGAVTGSMLPETTREMLRMAEETAAARLAEHVKAMHAQNVDAAATVARGAPLDEIAEAARAGDVDLVALGTHGKAGTDAFWSGSLTQRLLHRVPASFLLAPAAGGAEG